MDRRKPAPEDRSPGAQEQPELGEESTWTARALGDAPTQSGEPTTSGGSEAEAHYYGRYQLLGELGSGGMGIVYEAHDPELDRRVALKVIGHAQRRLGALARERLLREARAMARLAHPNVIAIHDVGSMGDEAFVAMELVKGCTLKAWLHQGPHRLEQVLDLFDQAGRGLAAAHAVGLVHRDFKPSNVIVGDDGRVRVLDFGLARLVENGDRNGAASEPVGDSPSLGALTHTGGIVGTPAYMAPEQCTGGNVDERSDQFSFCVALYEAVYGVAPFAGDSLDERATRIAAGDIAPAPDGTEVPDKLRAALLRGLRPHPDDRHPSMNALLAELIEQPSARRRRSPRALVAIALVLLLAVGGAVALIARSGSPDRDVANASSGLRMQIADAASEHMAQLAEYVDHDPRARRLGIESGLDAWSTSGGDNTYEHYLTGPDREALEDYLASVFRERADLAPEPGHELRLEQWPNGWRSHYLWTRVELGGSVIDDVAVGQNPDTGDPEVTIRFDEQGRALLAAVTGQNPGRRLATVVDGVVISSAVVRGPILGGQVTVTMQQADRATMEREARELAGRLEPR